MGSSRMSNLVTVFLVLLTFDQKIQKSVHAASSATLSKQGGYNDVLIAISDDIPSTDCVTIVENLKVAIQNASAALHRATDGRVYFGQVTILMPTGWLTNSACMLNTSSPAWPRIGKADMIVNPTHPVFGKQPFTLQHSVTCGVSSKLPIYLSKDYIPNGLDLVNEWLHYRYGVHDEIGVDKDPYYTPYYEVPDIDQADSPLITSCTNLPLKGSWVGNEWQISGDNSGVVSSLMFSTSKVPSIDRICNETTHQKAPPTKHNWICTGRSVGDVIFKNEDFINTGGYNETTALLPTNISVVTNTFRGYHVVLDVSSAMNKTSTWMSFKKITSALCQFIWFLPNGLSFSMDTFSSDMNAIQDPVDLNPTIKNSVMEKISSLQTISTNSTQGLAQALDHSYQMFKLGMEVILITTASSVEIADQIELYKTNLVGPHILSLSETTYEALSSLSYHGQSYFIPTDSGMIDGRTPATWTIDTLNSIHSQTYQYREKIEELTLELVNGTNNGTFRTESTGRILFSFFSLDDGNSFTFNEGSVYSPTGVRFFINRPAKSPDFYQAIIDPSGQVGEWSFSINVDVDGTSSARIDARLEKSANIAEPSIRAHTWTNSIRNQPVDWSLNPVTLYAQVNNEKRQPVSDLTIRARIIGNHVNDQPFEVVLTENNPADVTKGDGIYSAMVLNLPSNSSAFSFVVEIMDTAGTIDNGSFNGKPSAGSSIPIGAPIPLSLKARRYVYGGAFALNRLYNGSDVYPPDRVKDLQVKSFNSSRLKLSWTAPKDNYGTSNTIIRTFRITGQCDQEPVMELFKGEIQPEIGSLDKITKEVYMPGKGLNVFYVQAIDANGNEAPFSTATAIRTAKDPNNPVNPTNETFPDWLFWLLIAIGSALVIFLILVVSYCCCTTLRKKNSEPRQGSDWVQYGDTTQPDNKRSNNNKKKVSNKNENQSQLATREHMGRNADLFPPPNMEYSSSEWSVYSHPTESTGSTQYDGDEVFVRPVRVELYNQQNRRQRSPSISESVETSSFGEVTPPPTRPSVAPRQLMIRSPPPQPPVRMQQKHYMSSPVRVNPNANAYKNDAKGINRPSRPPPTPREVEAPLSYSPTNLLNNRFSARQDLASLQDDESSRMSETTLATLRRLGIAVSDDSQASLV